MVKSKYVLKIFCISKLPIIYESYFLAFGLNTEIYEVNFHIQSECWKIPTRKTPNTNTFDAVFERIRIPSASRQNNQKNRICQEVSVPPENIALKWFRIGFLKNLAELF